MSGTILPNLPTETGVARTDWAVNQAGPGPNATYKVPWSTVFTAINTSDVTTALGYTPLGLTGGTLTGGLTLSAGALSVAQGSITAGGAGVTGGNVILNGSTGADHITFQTAGVTIFDIGSTSNTLTLTQYSGGVPSVTAISINGASGATSIGGAFSVSGGQVFFGAPTGSTSAPSLTFFSKTSAKGTTNFTFADNATNSATTINVAAQAGTVTYTIPDHGASSTFLLSSATMGASGLADTALPLMTMRTATGLVLDATGGAALFAIASTVGTSLGLTGANAKSATITSTAITEFTVPGTYITAQNLTCVVNAKIAGTGTPGTKTLGVAAYLTATDGTQGANIGPATQNLTTSNADYSFTITGTTLTPGAKLVLQVQSILQETGGANNINAQINSLRMK